MIRINTIKSVLKMLFVLSFLNIISCIRVDNNYNDYINKFDNTFTKHFPKTLNSKNYDIITHESVRKNDIGIYLYLYYVDEKYIDSLLNIYKNNSLTNYLNYSDCLLIVNRFETLDTYESTKKVIIDYDTRIKQNKDCYNNKYPIPNFIDYRVINKTKNNFLDNDFVNFIIEAKNEVNQLYDLIPNPQMPENWSNSYSKGISINKNKREVIFWSVIW